MASSPSASRCSRSRYPTRSPGGVHDLLAQRLEVFAHRPVSSSSAGARDVIDAATPYSHPPRARSGHGAWWRAGLRDADWRFFTRTRARYEPVVVSDNVSTNGIAPLNG